MSPGDTAMFNELRYGTALLALVCLAHLPTTGKRDGNHSRACKEVRSSNLDKAYPLRVPGNPAAGREHGTAKDVRDYFNKCVANSGNIGEQPLELGNHTQTPSGGSDKGGQAPQQRRSFPDACFELNESVSTASPARPRSKSCRIHAGTQTVSDCTSKLTVNLLAHLRLQPVWIFSGADQNILKSVRLLGRTRN